MKKIIFNFGVDVQVEQVLAEEEEIIVDGMLSEEAVLEAFKADIIGEISEAVGGDTQTVVLTNLELKFEDVEEI